jgi:hypothetical protein
LFVLFLSFQSFRFAGSSSLRVAEEVRDLCQKRVVMNPGNESGQMRHMFCLFGINKNKIKDGNLFLGLVFVALTFLEETKIGAKP